MKAKLFVLTNVAKKMNENKITWAVGGSTLLFFHNIVSVFNDIDIMISDNDIIKVKRIMDNMGAIQKQGSGSKYKTKYFVEYLIDGIEVDIMSSFIIVKEDIIYKAFLEKEDINGYRDLNNESIPLQSLKDWKKYYELMDRSKKSNLIKEYLEC